MLLVALCSSLRLGLQDTRPQVVEFFAGKARICRLARSIGLRAVGHDVNLDSATGPKRSAMNINGSSGFMSLPKLKVWLLAALPKSIKSLVELFT